jgi:hypothetical protein
MIASGLNVIEVARRLGHSPTMCMDVHAHVFEEWEGRRIDLDEDISKARQIERAERALRGCPS